MASRSRSCCSTPRLKPRPNSVSWTVTEQYHRSVGLEMLLSFEPFLKRGVARSSIVVKRDSQRLIEDRRDQRANCFVGLEAVLEESA